MLLHQTLLLENYSDSYQVSQAKLVNRGIDIEMRQGLCLQPFFLQPWHKYVSYGSLNQTVPLPVQ